MAIDIVIGQYHHGDSVIHRLDPRIKITLMLALIVSAFFAQGIAGLLVLLGFEILVFALSAVRIRTILRATLPLLFFLLFPLVFNLFFSSDGTVLLHWGIILITDHGLQTACFFTLRLLVVFLVAVILTLTTAPITLCDAVASMLRPFMRFGLPVYEISMMASIALRFIPTLMDDLSNIRKAQLARGASFSSGGPLKRVKMLLPLFVPLFAQSVRHSETLALAMESRCYHGGPNRSHYRILRIEAIDIVAVIVCALLLAAMIVWL